MIKSNKLGCFLHHLVGIVCVFGKVFEVKGMVCFKCCGTYTVSEMRKSLQQPCVVNNF